MRWPEPGADEKGKGEERELKRLKEAQAVAEWID